MAGGGGGCCGGGCQDIGSVQTEEAFRPHATYQRITLAIITVPYWVIFPGLSLSLSATALSHPTPTLCRLIIYAIFRCVLLCFLRILYPPLNGGILNPRMFYMFYFSVLFKCHIFVHSLLLIYVSGDLFFLCRKKKSYFIF